MKPLFLLAVFLSAVLLMAGTASAHTLSVRLDINDTVNTVYIPGIGERASGSLPQESSFSSPPHFYLASYSGGFLNGLAAKGGTNLSVGADSDSHFIRLEQNLSGSMILLASTQGDWRTIDNRISLIEAGKFLSQISPSFAFPLGGLYPIRLLLKYPGINMQGDFIMAKGMHRLVVENRGFSGGQAVVEIRRG